MAREKKLPEEKNPWTGWTSASDAVRREPKRDPKDSYPMPGAPYLSQEDDSKVYDVTFAGDATCRDSDVHKAPASRDAGEEATLAASDLPGQKPKASPPNLAFAPTRDMPAPGSAGASDGGKIPSPRPRNDASDPSFAPTGPIPESASPRGVPIPFGDSPGDASWETPSPFKRSNAPKTFEGTGAESLDDEGAAASPGRGPSFAAFAPTRQVEAPSAAPPGEEAAKPAPAPPGVPKKSSGSRASMLLANMKRDTDEFEPASVREDEEPFPERTLGTPPLPRRFASDELESTSKPTAEQKSPFADKASGLPTGLENPFETGSDLDATPLPPRSRKTAGEENFAVILEPGGRVRLDQLIETVAAFRDIDARTARRDIRRGKGLLATGLTRPDALVLESALVAEGQPVRLARLLPALQCEPARLVKAIKPMRRLGRFGVEYADGSGSAEFDMRELRLLSAGLIASPPGEKGPRGLVADLFGIHRSQRWRLWADLDPSNSGEMRLAEDAAEGFLEAMGKLARGAERAEKTPIFNKIAVGQVEEKLAFPDFENYENYQRWIFLSKFAPKS